VSLCGKAERIEVFAHRGAGDRPENTAAAFERAIEQGADSVELDLQPTKNNEDIVVTHDAYLRADQCLSPTGKKLNDEHKAFVGDMTLEQIQQFDCGSVVHAGQKAVPGQRILSLEQLMGFLKAHDGLRMNIEIKYDGRFPKKYPADLNQFVDKVVEKIEKSGVPKERFLIQSFRHDFLARVKKKHPEWEISPLMGSVDKILEVPVTLGAQTVTPTYGGLTLEQVKTLQAEGIKVVPWTANSEKDMRHLVEMGVDGIITDRVDLFQKVKRDICHGH
jgi:glycerophosphoryl diester phosphodiesterase